MFNLCEDLKLFVMT